VGNGVGHFQAARNVNRDAQRLDSPAQVDQESPMGFTTEVRSRMEQLERENCDA